MRILALTAVAAAPVAAEEVAADAVPLDANVVVMGEEHDVPLHHLNQAEWIGRLEPAAVVFEMLTPDLAEVAMSGPDDLGMALRWTDRGWPDFETYAPIFDALGDAMILGAEVSREDLSRAVGEGSAGFAAVDPRFALGADLAAEEQAVREAEQLSAHCEMLPEEMLPGMVAAQRLRDGALAQAVLDGLEATGGPVAVVTGNGHARLDRGVPHLLGLAAPEVSVVALGQVTDGAGAMPFDAWVVTDVPEGRDPDPCAALR